MSIIKDENKNRYNIIKRLKLGGRSKYVIKVYCDFDHQKEDFEGIGKIIEGAETYFIQSYRHASEEAAPTDIFSAYSKEELDLFANIVKKYVKNVNVRGI